MQLSDIKGIKNKRLEVLNKAGIITPVDLISFFPKKYIDVKNLTDLATAQDGSEVVLLCRTLEQPKVSYIRKNMSIVKVKFVYDFKSVYVYYYNQPFMAKNIIPNKYYFVCGKLKKDKSFSVSNPQLIPYEENLTPIPVYSKIKSLPNNLLISAINTVLSSVTLTGYIPDDLRDKYNLDEINNAYNIIHNPIQISQIENAKRSVSIEYLVYIMSVYSLIRKHNYVNKDRLIYERKSQFVDFVKSLPYNLTCDQTNAIEEIVGDLTTNGCNRLLQGDVGCGKTIVAFSSMYFAYLNGYQSVLMVPTEVLARQHYNNAIKLFSPFNVKVVFLSGSTKANEREKIKSMIANGEADIIIGTHAVFSSDVEFSKLSLIITDEQHRFGVNQRSALENKAKNADVLVMSATPIPRTLALSMYGELGISIIKTKPAKKAQIYTRFVPKEKEESMWDYVITKAKEGQQTFVVCPRIDDEEDSEFVSAVSLYNEKAKLFKDEVGLLHSQLSESTKTKIMEKFVAGQIKVLISTTVVEVGIDVKNATSMIIYNADRFGLSQLHQLRGRVGRGEIDSYCFILSNNLSDGSKERLSVFEKCSDGFDLAEYDFNARGCGDFIGTNQHGKSGSFATCSDNIKDAKEISEILLKNEIYRNEIEATITDSRYDYFRRITLN